MKKNARDNLKLTLEELCNCDNHLNTAYLNAEDSHNRSEIRQALRAVGSAIDSAQDTLRNYKD